MNDEGVKEASYRERLKSEGRLRDSKGRFRKRGETWRESVKRELTAPFLPIPSWWKNDG